MTAPRLLTAAAIYAQGVADSQGTRPSPQTAAQVAAAARPYINQHGSENGPQRETGAA